MHIFIYLCIHVFDCYTHKQQLRESGRHEPDEGYLFVYLYIALYTYLSLSLYIYREREIGISICMCICICICMCICVLRIVAIFYPF